jgi:hypothetical protein
MTTPTTATVLIAMGFYFDFDVRMMMMISLVDLVVGMGKFGSMWILLL